jgi:hypothetical protein
MTHSQEFLHEHEEVQSKRTWNVRTLFVFFFVGVLIWGTVFLAATVHASTRLFEARDSIIQTKQFIKMFAFDSAKQSLDLARDDLASSKRVLPFVRSLAWLPFVGDSIEAFADVVASGEAVVTSFEPLIELGSDLIQLSGLSEAYLREVQEGISPEVTFDDLSTQTKRAILQRLSASADDLELLVTRMSILEEEMVLLSQSAEIGPLTSVLNPLAADLLAVQKPLQTLAMAAQLLPAFAGLDEPSAILLLFLNNDELRPGGGFIGSYGILEMSDGDIAHLETADVYALDNVAEASLVRLAPEPLQQYNAASTWFFRDSNWSPDFAESSRQAIELFFEEVSSLDADSAVLSTDKIEQVIAFTPTYASELLEITGAISVGGQTFTSQNVADLLEYQVQYGFAQEGTPVAQRKEILADLVNEMKARLYAISVKDWLKVLEVSKRAAREKQLLLYSTDEDVERVIMQMGWSGSIESQTVDTLMVVDANLASLKSDPQVERDITYELYQNTSKQWVGRVSIHYLHNGTFDWKTTRYRTYTRIYLPIGTQFLGVEGSWLNDKTQNPTGAPGPVDEIEELGLVSFGTFTSVEPRQQNTLVFEFILAPAVIESIKSGMYELTVFKQAGAQNNTLTLDLDFDKNVTHAFPAEGENQWGDDVYRLNTILSHDFEVNVEL